MHSVLLGRGSTWRSVCRAILDNIFRQSRRLGFQKIENYFNQCVPLYKGKNMIKELQLQMDEI